MAGAFRGAKGARTTGRLGRPGTIGRVANGGDGNFMSGKIAPPSFANPGPAALARLRRLGGAVICLATAGGGRQHFPA